MKKFLKLFSIVFIFVLSTGCVRYVGEMKVDKYKGMDMKITFSSTDYDLITREGKDQLIGNGFSVDSYKKNGYKGVLVTYQTKNIDKISVENEKEYNLVEMPEVGPNGMFTVTKGFFKNKYKSNLSFDASRYIYKYECSDGTMIDYDKYDVGMDCKKVYVRETDEDFLFSVEVEGGVLSHNASSKEGNTLSWNLNSKEITELQFEFERVNYFNIAILLIIIFLVVMLILTSIADGIIIRDKEKLAAERRAKAKKEAMAERVVRKEKPVKKQREEKKKEVQDTELSNMFDGNFSNKKKIPEMSEKLKANGSEESSFKDLYK